MKTFTLYSLGSPGTFLYDVDFPTQYTERLSFEISKNIYDLTQNGYAFTQVESADIDALATYCDGIISDFVSWQDNMVSAFINKTAFPDFLVPDAPASTLPIEFLVQANELRHKIILRSAEISFLLVSKAADLVLNGIWYDNEGTRSNLLKNIDTMIGSLGELSIELNKGGDSVTIYPYLSEVES